MNRFAFVIFCSAVSLCSAADAEGQMSSAPVQPQASSAASSTGEAEAEALLKRKEQEIAAAIEYENQHPKRTFITANTKSVVYAVFYNNVKNRIEKFGTTHFPAYQGNSLYGKLYVSIPVLQDGRIYYKDGGPKIEKGSGNSRLDRAALDIVRRAAPFGPIPKNLRTSDNEDVLVLIFPFDFTNESGAVPSAAAQ